MRLAADRHLALLHDLEQRALHLRRRAVDLVGQQEIGEHRAERRLELAVLLVVDPRADEVGGYEVRRELDPLELAADRLRDRLHRERLRETRNALDEKMATREKSDDDALEQVVLPDDDLLDLEEQTLHLAAGTDARRHGLSFLLIRWDAEPGRRRVDRDREADPAEHLTRWVDQPRDDTHNVSLLIHKWSAGIAGVHRGIELDESGDRLRKVGSGHRAIEAGDHAGRERTGEPERMADDERGVADRERTRVAERRRLELRRRRERPEDGDVAVGKAGDDLDGRARAVVEHDHQIARPVDDVQAGQDVRLVVDDHARAAARLAARAFRAD